MRPFVIYHKNPGEIEPVVTALQKRGFAHEIINPLKQGFAIEEKMPRYSIFFNSIIPSADQEVFFMLNYLKHLEGCGIRVINGFRAFMHDTSRAMQMMVMQQLGVKHPKTCVINQLKQLAGAATSLNYPVVAISNSGESKMQKFESGNELRKCIDSNRINLNANQMLLVQEYVIPNNGTIYRAETIGGKFAYAVKRRVSDTAPNQVYAEVYTPPAEVIRCVEAIAHKAGIDVGGVEFVTDDRDGRVCYLGVNTQSWHVNDLESLIGFDPSERIADLLEHEAVHLTEDIAVV